ncbi:sulfatase-like hydrolase/transferase [Membranihabitans marinus]|uniref:sulfatase-like hydrolase/transferase n=1 Tax=Membranihabitans marinus TaxID=1227546 RepID=UPI001F014D3A|nr:sulfatase-like hydrolase/transferase [Membranihabitans marinus]
MKYYLYIFLFCLCWGCQSTESTVEESVNSQPNILFLFADDQTYASIQALGNRVIHTPNLDRLVAKGTTFSHAYNMGGWNGAICVASRSMIISGAHIWRAKQKDERWRQGDSLALNQTWGKLMEAAGYNTYMSGKWHVQAPATHVFQTVRHVRPGMPGDAWGKKGGGKKVAEAIKNGGDVAAAMPIGYNRPLGPEDISWSASDTSFGGFWQGGKHWSEVLRDDALDYLDDAVGKENPFFMYIAFNAPHDPRQSPQEFLDLYSLDEIPVPKNFLPEYPWKEGIGVGPGLRDEALAPFPRTEYAVKSHIKEYYAIISHLDHQMGLILDKLEASGEMDNTYIFFTADHGLSVGHHGLIGKQNMYDHSMRVPMLVVGPDIEEGKILNQQVYLQDVMATSLELAKIKKPDYVEFHSFADILQNESIPSHYDAMYGAYIDVQRMIRKDGFKLIVYPKINKVLLFDCEKDAEEMNNLAEDQSYQSLKHELFQALIKKQAEMGDVLDLSGITL